MAEKIKELREDDQIKELREQNQKLMDIIAKQ